MKALRRYVYILEILEKIRASVGKTFLQKAIYILQEGLGVNLDYNYKLYFYGPYSQELTNDIEALNDMGLVDIKFDPEKYGYDISITQRGKKFLKKLKEEYNIEPEENKIEKVLSLIKGQNAKAMELLGTVLYFAKLTDDERELKKLVNLVKPHFSDSEIKLALKSLRAKRLL